MFFHSQIKSVMIPSLRDYTWPLASWHLHSSPKQEMIYGARPPMGEEIDVLWKHEKCQFPDSNRVEPGERRGAFLEEVIWPAGWRGQVQLKRSRNSVADKGKSRCKSAEDRESKFKKKNKKTKNVLEEVLFGWAGGA